MFGSAQSTVQLTFSGFVVAYGAFQLLYGPLSDRLGRKRVLIGGLAVAFSGSVLAVFAPGLHTLIAARVLQGAGAAASMVVGRAMVQDGFQGQERTRVMAFVGMAMGLCPPLATLVGGQLHVQFGWRANFVLIAILAVGLCIAAWRGLPSHHKTAELQPHWLKAMLSSYGRLAREPEFVLYVMLLSMVTSTFYAFLAGAPIVLGRYGVGPGGVGFYIMFGPLSYLVGNLLTSHLVRRAGEGFMMWLGQAVSLSGIVLMLGLALAGWNSPLAFAVPMLLLGLGNGFLMPPTLAGTVGLLPALAGSAAAVAGLMQQVLGAVGGFAVGLFSPVDAVNLGALMLALTLIGTVAHALLQVLQGKPGERAQRALGKSGLSSADGGPACQCEREGSR